MQSATELGPTRKLETQPVPGELQVHGLYEAGFAEVLSPEALAFVEKLVREHGPRRRQLLARRAARQVRFDAGEMPDFLPETKHIRGAEWTVAPIPADLRDRRVEITGPVERKMIINALNSGASVFMADFEDANSPTWRNVVQGQLNLRDAVDGTISYTNEAGKLYRPAAKVAVLMVRPRGWHLEEKHVLCDGEPVSASLFDFGIYFFHNVKRLLAKGTGPYFYLPKMESHLEARLWNDVFRTAQRELGIPYGTIRATVLLETIPAAFEMDEILYELRDHSAGLNCGRWDYIFSFIKKLGHRPERTLPDRVQIGMTRHFLHSYSLLAIRTCHRRGIHAIGGMAAYIPVKADAAANETALSRVREDKVREAGDGHDGTWVAHPGLVGLARECFDARMPAPNQLDRLREDVRVTREDLLEVPKGTISEQGVRHNVDVAVRYLATWLEGNGCVPLYNLMEDAATAEISRSQLWQWVHSSAARLEDGRAVDEPLLRGIFAEVSAALRNELGPERFANSRYGLAIDLIQSIVLKPEFTEFMTSVGYAYLD